MRKYIKEMVNLIFGIRKVIRLERVEKAVEATIRMMYNEVRSDILNEALKVAKEEVRSISREFGAKIR